MREVLRSSVLRRFVLCEAVLNVQFWFPVWFFFLRDRGFSLAVIVVADTLYRVVIVLAEAPLGVVADRWGRKRSYVALCVLTVVTFALAVNVTTTPGLLVAWSLWGIQWAAVSGVGSAYLVSLLRERAPQVRETAAFGVARGATSAVAAVSLLLSGPLYSVDIRLPFLACGGCALVALALAASLPAVGLADGTADVTADGTTGGTDEGGVGGSAGGRAGAGIPAHGRTGGGRRPWPILGGSTGDEVRLVAAGAIVLCVAWTTILLWQPLVIDQGWAATGAGLMYTAWAVAGMAAGLIVARTPDVQQLRPVVVGYALVVVGLLGTGVLPLLGPFLFVPLIGVGYWTAATLVEARIATTARPGRRATLVSLVSLFGGIGIALARPVLGVVYSAWGVAAAFGSFGVCAVLLSVPLLALLRGLRRPLDGQRAAAVATR